MRNKSLIKDLAKDKPVAAIEALIDAVSDYNEENKIAHGEINKSVKEISDKISSVDGNGDCIISRLRGVEEGLKSIIEQPKDDIGKPIERRADPPLEPQKRSIKEVWKDFPITVKVSLITLAVINFPLLYQYGVVFKTSIIEMFQSLSNIK